METTDTTIGAAGDKSAEVVETAKDTTVNAEGLKKTNSFIDNVLNADRKLEGEGTTETKVETAASKKTDKQGAAADGTETTDDSVVIKINIDGKEQSYDISDEATLEELRNAAPDGKIKININGEDWEYDLNNPEDVELLKALETNEEDDEETGNILEVKYKVGEDKQETDKYDLRKKEDRERLIQDASKGKFFEKQQAEFKKEKETFTNERNLMADQATYISYAMLNMEAQGKLSQQDFMELPYEQFIGSSEKRDKNGDITEESTEQGDLRNWNLHKEKVTENKQKLVEYRNDIKKFAESFTAMKNEFQSKHPEIPDAEKWISEQLAPYHAPLVTYGKVSYPKDTLEMLWTWKNLDNIIKEAEERGRRGKAKQEVKKDTTTTRVKAETKRPMEKANKAIDAIFDRGNNVEIVS